MLYALTLSEDTRVALYVLPIWFALLGVLYWLKTHRSAHQKTLVANFREKVIVQKAAAKAVSYTHLTLPTIYSV